MQPRLPGVSFRELVQSLGENLWRRSVVVWWRQVWWYSVKDLTKLVCQGGSSTPDARMNVADLVKQAWHTVRHLYGELHSAARTSHVTSQSRPNALHPPKIPVASATAPKLL